MQELFQLLISCFKATALTLGGASAMLPSLAHELVVKNGWLNEKEFICALALGQGTPGPVILGIVLAGVKVAGVLGAFLVALVLVLPGLAWMGLAGSLWGRFKNSFILLTFFRGIRPAIPGLLMGLAWNLLAHDGFSGLEATLTVLSLWLILRWRVSPAVMVLSAVFLGFLIH